MGPNEKQKRIRLSIQMPSTALLRFIERALKEDQFFEAAVENPIAALKDSGVRLNVPAFTPEDLATFLGALAGAREMVRKRNLKEISFEKIFGQAAEIRGATLFAETHRGMWTLFNRNALMDKEMFASVRLNFETLQDVSREALALKDSRLLALATRDLKNLAIKDIGSLSQARLEIDMAGKTESYRESDTGVTFHFDADKGIGSKRESSIDTYSTKNFAREGVSIIEQLLNGPLINPVDLVAISAKIETYTNIVEQKE